MSFLFSNLPRISPGEESFIYFDLPVLVMHMVGDFSSSIAMYSPEACDIKKKKVGNYWDGRKALVIAMMNAFPECIVEGDLSHHGYDPIDEWNVRALIAARERGEL
jgi:hypothetical protein